MRSEHKPNFEERLLSSDRTGQRVWRNRKNRALILELHYTADPARRDPEWIAREKAKYSAKDWATEMELSWETYGGDPVYQHQFKKSLHVLPNSIGPDENIPVILRGWDFGGSQSCIITQPQAPRLIVLDELPNRGRNTRSFAPEVIGFCNTKYGDAFHYIDIIDPSAMWEGKTATGSACADVMGEFGLSPIPASTNDPERRIDAVMKLLKNLHEGIPLLQVNPHCTMFIAGCEGGYQYPERLAQNQRADRPLKNEWSHIADAFQYAALHFIEANILFEEDEDDYRQDFPRYHTSR